MDSGANKTPVEMIREGAFGGTYFRDIYSGINGKWYMERIWSVKKYWSEVLLFRLCQNMMSVSIDMVLNAEHR